MRGPTMLTSSMRTRSLSPFRGAPKPSPSVSMATNPITPPASPMSTTASLSREPVLTKRTINPAVIKAEYAVRGAIPLRAEELRVQIEKGEGSTLPFNEVVSCNIGNPQQLDQKPLTFMRQIAALTEYPALLDSPVAGQMFPADALKRARSLLAEVGSVGAYSHSMGVPAIRQRVANFIQKRDGYPASADKIYLTAGASVGVSNLLQVLIANPSDGVLIPIPQYPLYTAALALNEAVAVPYYLDESKSWGLDVQSLKDSIKKARAEGTTLKAMVVINPGNPTGNCLSQADLEAIVRICHEERLVLLADEVYQDNAYLPDSRPFISFKKVLRSMPSPVCDEVELVSFHSLSKGQTGECGRRGGYFELANFTAEAEEQVYKLASIQLCPSLGGQIGVDVLVSPPQEGDESYPLWAKEKSNIAKTLQSRAETLVEAFNELEGVTCNSAEGAMYLFPTVTIPQKAIEAAEAKGMQPDAFYALELLEETGICVVPGSGFGQVPGTWHLRSTFLPPLEGDFVANLKRFHAKFMDQYR